MEIPGGENERHYALLNTSNRCAGFKYFRRIFESFHFVAPFTTGDNSVDIVPIFCSTAKTLAKFISHSALSLSLSLFLSPAYTPRLTISIDEIHKITFLLRAARSFFPFFLSFFFFLFCFFVFQSNLIVLSLVQLAKTVSNATYEKSDAREKKCRRNNKRAKLVQCTYVEFDAGRGWHGLSLISWLPITTPLSLACVIETSLRRIAETVVYRSNSNGTK